MKTIKKFWLISDNLLLFCDVLHKFLEDTMYYM
jgi:hypothetical protein